MTHDRTIAPLEIPILADDRSSLGLVVVGLAGLALGCLAALAVVAAFPLPTVAAPPSGVVGLVTIHGYPKSREPLYYAAIVMLVTLMPVACVTAWVVSARWIARWFRIDLQAALNAEAFTPLAALVGFGVALLEARQVRTLAVILLALVAATLVVLALPRRDLPARWSGAILGRRLFGAEARLASSTVALAGCIFGWFLPMTVPSRLGPALASTWWIWPFAFLGAWLATAWLAAGRAGQPFERAAPRSALAFLPALLMLAVPFLIDSPRARAAALLVTFVSIVVLVAWLPRDAAPTAEESATRAALRACRLGAAVVLSLAWIWEPAWPGVMVLPGDGDHLIAFLNDGLHGKLVYRDFWYPYGPLRYLLDFLSARLFGLDRYEVPTWLVTVALGTLMLGLTARMVFLTWPFRVVGPLLMILFWSPRPVEFRAYAGYFTVVLAVAAASSGRVWALRIAGALGAASFLFSHESAAAALVGAQPGILWACRQATWAETLRAYARCVRPFLAGLIGVLVPVALLAAGFGAFVPYLKAVFGFVGVTDECCGLPMPGLRQGSTGPVPPWTVRSLANVVLFNDVFRDFYLPVLLCIIVALYVVARALRGRGAVRQDAVLLGLVGFGLLYYRFVLGRSDVTHATFLTLTTLALGCALLERVALRALRLLLRHDGRSRRRFEELAELAILSGGAVFLAAKLGVAGLPSLAGDAANKLAHHPHRRPPFRAWLWQAVRSPAGRRFHFPAVAAPMVQATVDYLQASTQPGEGVFAFPYPFRYNPLLDRPNPLNFGSCLWGAAARPADQRRLVRELAEKKPRYIVYDESEWPDMDGVPTGDRFAEVADFIFSRYGLEKKIGATSVLRLGESSLPAAPSVVDVTRDEDRGFLQRGWYYPQDFGSVRARWTTTTATALLTRRAAHRELFIECHGYAPPGHPPRSLSASVDGQGIGRGHLASSDGWTTLRFPLPEPAAADAGVLVRLDIDPPFDPEPGRYGRRLGVIVTRIGLE